ncbi:MAG: glycosyltransferase family 2 protein [Desulfuromonadales bacterium]|nr:glycosyltransferase family 2 protein [Desulfuromonadales bacterium]
MVITVCIPLCDRKYLKPMQDALQAQKVPLHDILLLDSAADPVRADEWPCGRIRRIHPGTFDHGGTRRQALRFLGDADLIVFLTQDALPTESDSIGNLIAEFANPSVGVAFGRQLPRPEASPMEAHPRLFNYPAYSRVKSSADIPRLGIKTAFISNSFAAYRRTALEAIGGFPARCIVSEDTFIAARLLLAGWEVSYCAEAKVHHSHPYGYGQEFKRYFDVGVFHAREPWVRREFGGAEGEGSRYLKSEMQYLGRVAPHLIPSALVRNGLRYLGFRVGLGERWLPLAIKRQLTMQKAFWSAKPEVSGAQGTSPAL